MPEIDNSQRTAVKFIRDEPSASDFFGSHSRVAAAVSEVIGEDNGIHVVGLLGPWGSGKSTVVSHIQKQLNDRHKDIHFFNYDAWLYQNDPPRRSFLEALIQDLVQNSLTETKEWENRLADLSGRSEETTTETTRELSLTGKWIIGSMALVPIGTIFLTRALQHKEYILWQIIGGGSLTLAPLIMAGLFYLSWRPWRQIRSTGCFSKNFWLKHREPHSDQSIFALLTNQSIERTEKKTKISPEPSVMEFRNVFRDVLKRLRTQRERLVIVIDNLDRLAEAEAVDLWATIRSLFLGSELTDPQRLELAWPAIILPIDEGSVERMFQASGHQGDAGKLARSFMDKTFDLSFYVNDPVMSDWRAFFREKLEHAFGETVDDERVYWATKFVEDNATSAHTKDIITPRFLVKLVNAVGVLVKQWGDGSIDFLSMVFFALHRNEASANIREFINRDWPSVGTATSDWQRDVVALHYGVPREKAFQALLKEPLQLAITGMDQDEFSHLAKVVGFGPVFEELISHHPSEANIPDAKPNFIANAALLVSRSDSSNELWAKKGMQKLASMWSGCERLDSYRTDFASIIEAFALFDTTSNLLPATANLLGQSLSNAVISPDVAQSAATALQAIREAADPSKHSNLMVQLTMDVPALALLLEEIPKENLPMLRTDKSVDDVLSALVTQLDDPKTSKNVAPAIRALASSPTIHFKDKVTKNWNGLVNAAYNWVSSHSVSFHTTQPSIDVLGLLYGKNKNAKSFTEQLFDQGHLANRLNEADQEDGGQTLADIAALMFLRGADFAAPNGKTWETILTEAGNFDTLFENALTWYTWSNPVTFCHKAIETRPSLKPVIAAMITRDIKENHGNSLTTDHLLRNKIALDTLIGPDLVSVALAHTAARQDLWSTLDTLQDGRQYDDAVKLLASVQEVKREGLIANVKERLLRQDVGSWSEAIEDEVFPYSLVEIYRTLLGEKDVPGDSLKSALSNALSELDSAKDGARERWFALCKFISKSARVTLFKNLRDKIQSGASFYDLPGIMRAGGSQLLTEGQFEKYADKTTRHVIIPLLSDELGLIFASENIKFLSRCVSASDEETKNVVRETLSTLHDEFGDIEPQATEIVYQALLPIMDTAEEQPHAET